MGGVAVMVVLQVDATQVDADTLHKVKEAYRAMFADPLPDTGVRVTSLLWQVRASAALGAV